MSAVGLLRFTLCALTVFGASAAAAQPEDRPGPDPLRVSLTTGFSVRNGTYQPSQGVPPLNFSGATPPPSARLAGVYLFNSFLGVAVDASGEWFSIGLRGLDKETSPIGRRKFAYTWSGSVAAVGRLVPTPILSFELHLGWAFRGETPLKQDDLTGKLDEDNFVYHQGPYATLAVGIHPQAPFAFLAWAKAAPFAVHTAGSADLPPSQARWFAFGAEVAIGRMKLSNIRAAFLVQYEANLRNVHAIDTDPAVHDAWDEVAHNIGIGVRVSLAGPPVDEAPRPDQLPPGSLLGTVVGEDGVPVWKAKVTVAGGAPLETDAQGQFTVEGLRMGEVTVTASAEGFKPATQTVAIASREQATPRLVLKRPTGPGKLKGKVMLTDPDRPAAGAEVEVAGRPPVVAGDDGSYAFADVGPGPVGIKVSATGYVPAEEMVQVPPEGEATFDVKLSNKKPNALLRGKVAVKEGTLEKATVTVKQKKLTVNVGADGRFSIELPGGRYDIVVEAPGYRTQTRTIDVGYGDQTIYFFELRPNAR